MLNLKAILTGKSAHRDGGFVLTFMMQSQEFRVRVNDAEGAEFADTATVIPPQDEQMGEVQTVHATELKQYSVVITEIKAPVKPVAPPVKPATLPAVKPVGPPAKPVVPPPVVKPVPPPVKPPEKPVEVKPKT